MMRWFPPLTVWILLPTLGIAFWYVFRQPPLDYRTAPPENIVSADTEAIPDGGDIVISSALSYEAVLQEVQKRPLFSETRRVPAAVVETPPPAALEEEVVVNTEPATVAAPEPPYATFHGYMLADGRARALIALRGAQTETWMSVGDMLRNWSVVEIEQSAVHLELQGFQHVLTISR